MNIFDYTRAIPRNRDYTKITHRAIPRNLDYTKITHLPHTPFGTLRAVSEGWLTDEEPPLIGGRRPRALRSPYKGGSLVRTTRRPPKRRLALGVDYQGCPHERTTLRLETFRRSRLLYRGYPPSSYYNNPCVTFGSNCSERAKA